MKKGFIYNLLLVITWPMQLFPLEFHYVVSEILYFLVYKVFSYRKAVVRTNLRNSFPLLSEKEIKEIEKDFYHGFVDMFIETLYFTHIDAEKEKNRLEIVNYSVVEKLIEQKRNVVIVMGHFGNWEFLQLFIQNIDSIIYFVYKKLNNLAFDQFYRDLRGRAGTPLEMKQTFRKLYNDTQESKNFIALFISDQRPLKGEIKHWVPFLNQDTPVMLGTEKIARKTNSAIVYLELSKKKRGYHVARFELLFENAGDTAKHEITNTFMQKLENSINQSPSQYLWTHKRWKHKRE